MRLLLILANLNIGCRKAAAPNKGAAAFLYSTVFCILHHAIQLFKNCFYVGDASKKA